jgi:hypothetical protein
VINAAGWISAAHPPGVYSKDIGNTCGDCALRALILAGDSVPLLRIRGALSRGLILVRGAAPRAGYFSLFGQRKLTKRKAAPMSRPAGTLRYSPGAGSSDGTSVCRRKNARHPWRAPCGLIRSGLRCSARQRG